MDTSPETLGFQPGLQNNPDSTNIISSPPAPSRFRSKTTYKGVTRTSTGSNKVHKFDVQFVFCDGGTKKHPKIYGFGDVESAARAFDILVIRRALEKDKPIDATSLGGENALGNNFSLSEYQIPSLLEVLQSITRDDLIYGLKQAAKKGLSLHPSTLEADLAIAIEAANIEAEERSRNGDPRQSYLPSAKASDSERKRKLSAGGGTNGTDHHASGNSAGKRCQPQKYKNHQDAGGAMPQIADPAATQMLLNDFGKLSSMLTSMGHDPSLLALLSQQMQQPIVENVLGLPLQQHQGGVGNVIDAEQQRQQVQTNIQEIQLPAGTSYFMDICRAASNILPEMICVIDLLRLYEFLRNAPQAEISSWSDQQYFLPAANYQQLVEKLRTCNHLGEVITLCSDFSRDGTFRSMLLATTYAAQVNSLPPSSQAAVPPAAEYAMNNPSNNQQTHHVESTDHQQHALTVQDIGSGQVSQMQLLLQMAAGGGTGGGGQEQLQRLYQSLHEQQQQQQ